MIGIINSQFDKDALDFLSRASITNPTERLAINYLVTQLKLNSLYTKFFALYPIVGGTSSTTSHNLISSSYQLTYTGSWTYSSNGIIPGGTTSDYASTSLTPLGLMNVNSTSVGIWSRTDTANIGTSIGVADGDGDTTQVLLNGITKQIGTFVNHRTTILVSSVMADTIGLFISSRTSSSAIANYRNGTSVGTTTTAPVQLPSLPIAIGARTNGVGTVNSPSDRELALAFIATGFSAAEVAIFYPIIQTFQTILGR